MPNQKEWIEKKWRGGRKQKYDDDDDKDDCGFSDPSKEQQCFKFKTLSGNVFCCALLLALASLARRDAKSKFISAVLSCCKCTRATAIVATWILASSFLGAASFNCVADIMMKLLVLVPYSCLDFLCTASSVHLRITTHRPVGTAAAAVVCANLARRIKIL